MNSFVPVEDYCLLVCHLIKIYSNCLCASYSPPVSNDIYIFTSEEYLRYWISQTDALIPVLILKIFCAHYCHVSYMCLYWFRLPARSISIPLLKTMVVSQQLLSITRLIRTVWLIDPDIVSIRWDWTYASKIIWSRSISCQPQFFVAFLKKKKKL